MDAEVTVRGGICRLVFGYGAAPGAGIAEVIKDVTEQSTIRAIVLSGPDRQFLADPDAAEADRRLGLDPVEQAEDDLRISDLLLLVDQCPKPVVARVDGIASGLGLGLVAAADVAVAAEEAEFAVTDVRLGLTPTAVTPFLARAVGHRNARRMILTGDRIRAAEAKTMGLVHEVTPRSLLDAGVDRMLVGLLKAEANAFRNTKSFLRSLSGPFSS